MLLACLDAREASIVASCVHALAAPYHAIAARFWERACDHDPGITPAPVGQINRCKARHLLILPSPIGLSHRHMAIGSLVGTRAVVVIVQQHVVSECGHAVMIRA